MRGSGVELPADPAKVPAGRVLAEGDVVEVNEPARAFVATVAARVRRYAGTALFLDYGPGRSAAGDSLQALADKRPVNPLSPPGSADLTAHVDFADLAVVARAAGAGVQGPAAQGAFLLSLGLLQRTERLARGRSPAEGTMLVAAAERLAGPMGELFKVMAVCSDGCPPLPGMPVR